jgi:hypothetical protein
MKIHQHQQQQKPDGYKNISKESIEEYNDWRANKYAEQASNKTGLGALAAIVFFIPAYLVVIENYDPMVAVYGIGGSLAIFGIRYITGLIQY